MNISDTAGRRRLRRKLMKWFERNRRDLPWRESPRNAYHQWLAETMLQQTQVATVIPYFNKFAKRFPTVRHLADASVDDVLKLWAGLGYYARARNLHKSAQIVASELSGQFPDTAEDLASLPGIGRYTAGAIASIAFGKRAPTLDGNVKRVLSRLFLIRSDIKERGTVNRLWTIAEEILPRKRCGDFNQALMELGAMVCLPRNPKCQICPLAGECAALAVGMTERLPKAAARARPTQVNVVVAAIQQGHKYLIRQREHASLWAGMWEMPSIEMNGLRTGKAALLMLLQQLRPRLSNRLEIPARPCGRITHRLTHRIVSMSVYHCAMRTESQLRCRSRDLRWVMPEEFDQYAFATAQRKVLELIMNGPNLCGFRRRKSL